MIPKSIILITIYNINRNNILISQLPCAFSGTNRKKKSIFFKKKNRLLLSITNSRASNTMTKEYNHQKIVIVTSDLSLSIGQRERKLVQKTFK